MKVKLLHTIPVANGLGEGVLWDPREGAFWWTDIDNSTLHRFELDGEKHDTFKTPERLTAFGFTDTLGVFVAGFESGFAFFTPETGEVDWIGKPFAGIKGLRVNDGRVDPKGRFWCGTMAEDGNDATIREGSLYRLDDQLHVSAYLSSIHIANSICWSPDGSLMYFADSPTQRIRCFDFDLENGSLSSVHTFATTQGNIYPDGSITDKDGYVWNAQWGGGQVVRYTPGGDVDFTLKVPASQPTCAAFGGENLDLLAVTSATQGLSDARLKDDPEAGHLFIYKVDAQGLPSTHFKGKRS